ncbi:cadherin-1-like isoform X2 [Myxocyprinus asiaticus]|uniref:cadherin-1-like isoform X2 n=1 Tax=Myxocyprinus asiaticus TaxID=70543 RepID=UPI002222BA53|nr:cadherin-1-like isoform X2 [Myxocyprinus asiaticus]
MMTDFYILGRKRTKRVWTIPTYPCISENDKGPLPKFVFQFKAKLDNDADAEMLEAYQPYVGLFTLDQKSGNLCVTRYEASLIKHFLDTSAGP